MNPYEAAISEPCYLPEDTTGHQYDAGAVQLRGGMSLFVRLTVNSGFE